MKIFMGLFILLIGLLLLFGVFNASIWIDIVNNFLFAWPVIFVFIGISILSGIEKLHWLRYINSILIILFTLYLIFGSGFNLTGSNDDYEFTHTINPTGEVVRLDIDFPEILVDLEFVKDSNEIRGVYTSRGNDLEMSGTDDSLRLTSTSNYHFIPFGMGRKITLYLPENYKYRIDSDSAVFRIEDRFIENRIEKISLNSAVVQIDLQYDIMEYPLAIDVNSAIINSKIIMPESTTYRGNFDGAFKSLDIELKKSNDSPDLILDYDAAIMNLDLLD